MIKSKQWTLYKAEFKTYLKKAAYLAAELPSHGQSIKVVSQDCHLIHHQSMHQFPKDIFLDHLFSIFIYDLVDATENELYLHMLMNPRVCTNAIRSACKSDSVVVSLYRDLDRMKK